MLDRTFVDELSCGLHIEQVVNVRDNSYVRVSGVSDCRRKIGYRLTGFAEGEREQPNWSHALSIFDIGHGIHLRLQQRLSNAGPLKWVDADPVIDHHGTYGLVGNCEIPLVNNEYKVRGHCDALSRPLKKKLVDFNGERVEIVVPTEEDDPEGTRYIIDIKSITGRERLVSTDDPLTGKVKSCEIKPSSFEKLQDPKPEHIAQASIYSWMTTQKDFTTDRIKKPLEKMPDVMIIYVAKDIDPGYYGKFPGEYTNPKGLLNIPYKVFTQPVDIDHVNVLLRKIQGVWKSLEAGKLPPRDYHYTAERPAWACVDCPFRAKCYESEGWFENESLEIPSLLAYKLSTLNQ